MDRTNLDFYYPNMYLPPIMLGNLPKKKACHRLFSVFGFKFRAGVFFFYFLFFFKGAI